jgi:Protein of unknown function (DUF4446)
VPVVISVVLSVIAAVLAGAGILIAVGAHRRSMRLTRSWYGTSRPATESRTAGAQPGDPPAGDAAPGEARGLDPRALRDIAIVRYDALQEMSGQLSFSLALLNAQGDGIVLTSINGRAESRTYAKAVVAGKSAQPLSPEEEEAVRTARRGQGPDGPARDAPKPKITSQTGTRSNAAFTRTG